MYVIEYSVCNKIEKGIEYWEVAKFINNTRMLTTMTYTMKTLLRQLKDTQFGQKSRLEE